MIRKKESLQRRLVLFTRIDLFQLLISHHDVVLISGILILKILLYLVNFLRTPSPRRGHLK